MLIVGGISLPCRFYVRCASMKCAGRLLSCLVYMFHASVAYYVILQRCNEKLGLYTTMFRWEHLQSAHLLMNRIVVITSPQEMLWGLKALLRLPRSESSMNYFDQSFSNDHVKGPGRAQDSGKKERMVLLPTAKRVYRW